MQKSNLIFLFLFKDVTNTTGSLTDSSSNTSKNHSPAQSPAPQNMLHVNPTEITLLEPEN